MEENRVNYLVIGNGARESAILWKLHQDEPDAKLFCLPGNGGTSEIATNVAISPSEQLEVADFAEKNQIDLTIVGPEQPLVEGIVDVFHQRGLAIIGPDKATAQLEGSKAFAKEFMKKYQIPTANYVTYDNIKEAIAGVKEQKYPFVIKADGLAAGKGVLIVENEEQAMAGLKQVMEDKKFGVAGNKVVFEEFLTGIEASLICFVDGKTILPMESARDYKRAYDEDKGLNTGGMGCFSPNPILQRDPIKDEIKINILDPILKGIQAENMDYRGILFIGLMLTERGVKVIEFNVRFGDPETEVLLPRLQSSLPEIMRAVYQQNLASIHLEWSDQACVGVVLASAGYPENYESGKIISIPQSAKNEMIFYGGTARDKDNNLITAGGRVLVVATCGLDIETARKQTYQIAERISFDGRWFRRDIAGI